MQPSTLDLAACRAALGAHADAFELIALAQCDSTNTELMQLAEAGAHSATVMIADAQTAGRGRRERSWVSSPQHSLTFSLLWRFAADSHAPQALSLAVGLAVQRALKTLGAACSVKWPNDVLHEGRKLAGILIETQPGDIRSAVIGIGVNLRLPPGLPADVAGTATALERLLAATPAREAVLGAMLGQLKMTLECYAQYGFAALRDEWLAHHAFQQRDVRLSDGTREIVGRCTGVSDAGELLIATAQGTQRVLSGDLSLRAA